MPTDPTTNDPAPPANPTEAEVARALEWSLNTQPRRRRDGDEATEVSLLAHVPSVAADLADRAPDPEILKLTAIRILETRLEMLPTADQAVARILLEFHTPIADRNEQIGALAGSTSKTLPLRDQTIYRMSAVLLDRDRATVESLEVPETPEIAGRRFRIGVAIGIASLVLGVLAILLAVYTDFLRDETTEDASVPLRFELSADECDIATSCNSEANAVTALVAGFTPSGFADVRIIVPSGVDANELSAEFPGYGYRTPLEVNDDGSFLWQYWWDPPMALGTYEIEITDRETNRVATRSMTFLDSQADETDDDAPANDEDTILYATILGESPLNVRAQPTTESEIAGTVEVGSRVTVTCYARGEVVTLDSNDPGNDLWHLIVGPGPDPIQGYATDVFLNTPTGAEPLDGEPACAETVVADHAILTLTAGRDGPTELASFEAGPTIQGQLVGGATAQPAGVTNTFVQVSGPGQQECMWDTAQRLEAGVLGTESDPNQNFLFVIEQIRDDEIDVRVYDVRGDLGIDEVVDEKGCRKLGVLGLDTPEPDWIEPSPPPPQGTTLTQLASADGAARLEEVVGAATEACNTYGATDHGSTVDVLGIRFEVVWAPAHAERAGRTINERGGYPAPVTGEGPFMIIGTDGGDDLTSHQASDLLCGRGGDDLLAGKAGGDDFLIGGPGSDTLKASSGLNILVGDDDDSELTGGSQLDWCSEISKAFSGCENRF